MTITPQQITLTAQRVLERTIAGGLGAALVAQVRAAYEPAGPTGPAAYGYGPTEADALADLADTMTFNLASHGALV